MTRLFGGTVEKQNPRKGTETENTLPCYMKLSKNVEKQNPRKGTETFMVFPPLDRNNKVEKQNPRKGTETARPLFSELTGQY